MSNTSYLELSLEAPLLEPAADAIEYETVKFDGGFLSDNVYKGKPNKQLDQAWNRIASGKPRSVRSATMIRSDSMCLFSQGTYPSLEWRSLTV